MDFMFELSEDEIDMMVSHFVIPSKKSFGGAIPFAFTELGVAMLSSVLKSKKAVEMNIAIMRTFVTLRKLAVNYSELLNKIVDLEKKYDMQLDDVYQMLNYLLSPQAKRAPIGFKRNTI
jgi:ORF6N domain